MTMIIILVISSFSLGVAAGMIGMMEYVFGDHDRYVNVLRMARRARAPAFQETESE